MTVRRPRSLALRGLHLLALSAFALAQPLFDLLGDTPEFFVVRGSTGWDIVALALGLVLVPPAVLLALEAVAGLVGARLQDALHLLFVGALTALLATQALKRVGDLSSTAIFALAIVAGAAFAAVYARRAAVRSFLTVLAPAPAVFLGLFLLHSPLEKLSLESEAHAKAPPVSSTTPVVLVVFDELPVTSLMDARRRIDSARYPNFAALAADSTWFREATTVHEHTTEAVPAIMSGIDPRAGSLPLLRDHPDNVFTFLGASYAMHVFEPVTQLCPTNLCPREREPFPARMESLGQDLAIVYGHVLLPEETARRLPSVTDTWQNFGKEHADEQLGAKPLAVRNAADVDRAVGRQLWSDVRFQFERYAYSIRPTRRPTLFFLHSMLPHAPWRFLPSGRQYGDALGIDGIANDRWGRDEWLVTQGFQRHLLQTGFVDRLLGILLARLRAARLYERSLVVVVADHGVSFRPGDRRRGVTPTNLGDIAPVPLFVKKPHQHAPRIVDRNVRTVDIVPTIADVLGAPLPYHADGLSLFDPTNDRGRVEVDQRVGKAVSAGVDAAAEEKYETLRRKLAIFGSGRTGSLYAFGRYNALVGRKPSGIGVVGGTDLAASVDNEALLASVDLGSALAPSHVTGRLDGDAARAGVYLALAVNGRIAGVTRSFTVGDDVLFSALLRESAFRQGRNEVDVFAVRAREGRLGLEQLGGTDGGASYALRTVKGADEIAAGHRPIPVVSGAVQGEVEDWFFEADTVRIGGWAGDMAEREPADLVVAFADGQLVYSGTPSVGRADLAERYPGLGRSGFVAELPRTLLASDGEKEVRFFAIRGDVASELAYAPGFPWKR
ncbi:MAG: sulfatase-like hydrolase/transferase [Actinomycetota bacterium]|nr:sulfatase-like hydrolase/transferase [Actinomycetota bacterium]